MEQTRRDFARIVAPGDGSLQGHLDEAALLIAAAVDPSVSVFDECARLDQLAHDSLASTASTPAELANALFGGAAFDPARHFGGNRDDYYDIENSLLNRVLDRRLGIPITLSVLMIEVGRRRDIRLAGVGMPGHFLVGHERGFIDPFNHGNQLDSAGCLRVFQSLAGANAALPAGALDPTPPALIVKRMLVNLAAAGAESGQRRLLWAVRSLLAVYPDAGHREHVQHAFAAAEIGQFREAADAADRALPSIPERVRDKMQAQIDAWRARLN